MNGRELTVSGWRRAASTLFVLAAFAFLGYFGWRSSAQLRAYEWQIRPGLLVLSVLANAVALFLGVGVWQMLLRRMNVSVRLLPLARVWFVSGLGRYIPGKIWQFVGAAQLGSAVGLGGTIAVTSLLVHTGIFVVGALIVAIYLLPDSLAVSVGLDLLPLRWIAPAILLFVHPAIIGRALDFVHRISGRSLTSWSGRWFDGIALVALAVAVWIASGLAFHLFLTAVTPLYGIPAADIVAVNALAFVAGYLVFFVPAGLGAKEGALAALLSIWMPASVAAVLAIAARLWMVAAEVLPAIALLRFPAPAPGITGGAPRSGDSTSPTAPDSRSGGPTR